MSTAHSGCFAASEKPSELLRNVVEGNSADISIQISSEPDMNSLLDWLL
jgi:hypothetical protein